MRTLQKLQAPVSLERAVISEETRTVELCWYTGASVYRYSWDLGEFELEFSMEPKAVRMERLKSGRAPLLNAHRQWVLTDIMGVVEKASLKGSDGFATVRFSKRDDVEPLWQDVKDRIIRNISMGAVVHQMKEVTEKGDPIRKFLAIDWEPWELSFVPIGADPGAQSLSHEQAERFPCVVDFSANAAQEKDHAMKIKVRLLATNEIVEIEEDKFDEKLHSKNLAPDTEVSAAQAAQRVSAAIERDRAVAGEIRRVAEHYGLGDVWAQGQINLGTSVEKVIELATAERARRAPKTANELGTGSDNENANWRIGRMVEALAARATHKEPPREAHQYALSTFVECALECLSFSGKHHGLDVRRDKAEIVKLALHGTSDFPLLLGNVLNKIMLPAYESANPTYKMLAQKRDFTDFRAHRFLRRGDFPVPKPLGENGEYSYGTMGENQEQVTLASFGRIIGFGRQSLINDDIGALEEIATMAGIRAADFENKTFFDVCILIASGLGPNLSDAVAVYNSAHGNTIIAGALDETRLSDGRAKAMKQTSLDAIKLNVALALLLVSPDSLTTAERLVATIQPVTSGTVNPFSGKLTPIGDANLTGTRFYMLADPSRMPQYIYGSLSGQSGPRTEVRAGFEVDGVEFKLGLDFGCGAIDFRAGVTGAGV